MSADYYNEWEQYCAQWLRNLIAEKLIPDGDVDERSITEVRADDLRGYRQCHFFAGIGGWPYALRLAGWPIDQEVWTGSCPCQPLSCAGKRKGHDDERHLWPAFFRLIAERRPATIFGEQVSGKDGLEWLSAVRADLEGIGYAVGAADLSACSVGAPHIRRRLFWVAHAMPTGRSEGRSIARRGSFTGRSESFESAHSSRARLEERQKQSAWQECEAVERSGNVDCTMEHAASEQVGVSRRTRKQRSAAGELGQPDSPRSFARGEAAAPSRHGDSSVAASVRPWSGIEWLPCIDGKWRPTKPGIQPLAHGIPARVGKLRAAGNAIVPQVAAEFIGAVMECIS